MISPDFFIASRSFHVRSLGASVPSETFIFLFSIIKLYFPRTQGVVSERPFLDNKPIIPANQSSLLRFTPNVPLLSFSISFLSLARSFFIALFI